MQSAAMPGNPHRTDEVEYTSLYLSAKKNQSCSQPVFGRAILLFLCVLAGRIQHPISSSKQRLSSTH